MILQPNRADRTGNVVLTASLEVRRDVDNEKYEGLLQ